MSDILALLDKYADLKAAPIAIELKRDETIHMLLGDDLYQQLQHVLTLADQEIEQVEKQMKVLEAEIKPLVLQVGSSVKSKYQAVYTPPGWEYDTKMLDGYAAAHPEIIAFRKEKKASVALRPVK